MISKYLIGGSALIILLMGAAIWLLMGERDSLNQEIAEKRQALSNAAHANRENVDTIKRQEADIRWREEKALERIRRDDQNEKRLANVIAQLREDLKHAPCTGPDYLWPDAVYDRMRQDTDGDPDRDGAGESTGGVPATNADTGTQPAG